MKHSTFMYFITAMYLLVPNAIEPECLLDEGVVRVAASSWSQHCTMAVEHAEDVGGATLLDTNQLEARPAFHCQVVFRTRSSAQQSDWLVSCMTLYL